ncbi:hypothetical protein EYF80_053494 [Liparis tanakae]|uniref:Uncharacterized protein n=1 Tax=Liparis tanakae TaxID=230148 RepID=A0A4Z2F5F7_9TELE|nr:hypothetical protein EYF80_053494 [Liparis tanakae]
MAVRDSAEEPRSSDQVQRPGPETRSRDQVQRQGPETRSRDQLADEVLLPELGEPDVPPVVGERAALEVSVERCEDGERVPKTSCVLHGGELVSSALVSFKGENSCPLPSSPPPSPSTDALLGRMVTAPSATRSCWTTGEILDPQLSDPTHRKIRLRQVRQRNKGLEEGAARRGGARGGAARGGGARGRRSSRRSSRRWRRSQRRRSQRKEEQQEEPEEEEPEEAQQEAHRMSSSLANRMTQRALGVSIRRRSSRSNSPPLGSRGTFRD